MRDRQIAQGTGEDQASWVQPREGPVSPSGAAGTGAGGMADRMPGVLSCGGNSFNFGWTARYEGTWASFGKLKGARQSAGRWVCEASAGSSAFSQFKNAARSRCGRRDHAHLCRRREESDRRRIDDLEEIKTKRMQRGRGEQKSGDRELSPARTFPAKEQAPVGLRVARRVHG